MGQTYIETEEDIVRAATIDVDRIRREFADLPAVVGRWRFRLAEAEKLLRLREAEEKEVESRCREEIRDACQKKALAATATDGIIREKLPRMDAFQTAQALTREARVGVDRLRAMVETLRDKREMLVSLGAHLRAELEARIS